MSESGEQATNEMSGMCQVGRCARTLPLMTRYGNEIPKAMSEVTQATNTLWLLLLHYPSVAGRERKGLHTKALLPKCAVSSNAVQPVQHDGLVGMAPEGGRQAHSKQVGWLRSQQAKGGPKYMEKNVRPQSVPAGSWYG